MSYFIIWVHIEQNLNNFITIRADIFDDDQREYIISGDHLVQLLGWHPTLECQPRLATRSEQIIAHFQPLLQLLEFIRTTNE